MYAYELYVYVSDFVKPNWFKEQNNFEIKLFKISQVGKVFVSFFVFHKEKKAFLSDSYIYINLYTVHF
jgi:hypothetical protein